MADSLKDKLLNSVELVEDHQEFSDDDFRWAETKFNNGKPQVYINDRKFKEAGSSGYQETMLLAESLHNLKNIDPSRYKRMEQAALTNEDYLNWAQESYKKSVADYGERRDFWDWHKNSRFDQVIGGYLFSGDKNIPTMKDWKRDELPFGSALKSELAILANDMELQ